ncbi:hypothetical protein [Roseivirga sp.]|uniref:hypothetical protein n=1 Tax=Roseivirga sp. TaxID=1964215 RepID=UPI003B8E828E
MKPRSILTLFFILSFTSCNQTKLSENVPVKWEDSEVKSIIDDFFIALGTSDSTKMNSILSNEFYMFEHDELWTSEQLTALMPLTVGREWEVKDLKVKQNGDLIHVSYFNQGIIPDDRSWFESMLIKDYDGTLKIEFMHSTKLYLK